MHKICASTGAVLCLVFLTSPAGAQRADGMNEYIIRTVERFSHERARGGYDLRSYFTRDLSYGDSCCVNANHPPATMCVAAVTEILIEAINLYVATTSDRSPYARLPIRFWKGGSRVDLRPYIFMYGESKSRGTAYALQTFGLGREIPFEQLLPGDMINLNRSGGTGHAVIFMGYLDAAGDALARYSDKVAGFRYFSAQGKNSPDAGMAYRWAFFQGTCPNTKAGQPRDCGIIRSQNHTLLNSGYMLKPQNWTVESALQSLKRSVLNTVYRQSLGVDLPDSTLDALTDPSNTQDQIMGLSAKGYLAEELAPLGMPNFDGVTTD